MDNRTEENKAVAVFGQNTHFAFLYKKTEKLIAAIYMITDFVRDNEPLKWRIREKALELLSHNIRFTTVSLSERRELLKKYQAISLEIVSLSGIAQLGGLISEMNYSILKREFEKLSDMIAGEEHKKASEETVILTPGFFDRAPDAIAEKPHAAPAETTNVLYSAPAISKGQSPKSQPERRPEQPVKNDRKSIIIKLLSKKSGLNIKDFSQAIKDCSEKTIQRELLALVAAGTLKKEGERRWSTYSLAK